MVFGRHKHSFAMFVRLDRSSSSSVYFGQAHTRFVALKKLSVGLLPIVQKYGAVPLPLDKWFELEKEAPGP